MEIFYKCTVMVKLDHDGTVHRAVVLPETMERDENYAGSPGERAAMTAAYDAADDATATWLWEMA